MAKINLGMRHGDVDTTQKEGGGALPDGFYRIEVDELSPKDHHDNRRGYKLDAVFEVIEPEQLKGRKIFIDWGVDDPDNPWQSEAEDWARQDFAKFLRAIDFPADKEFEDTDDAIGQTAIVRYGLDRKRSDKQNKRYGKVWGYVYPEDERDFLDKEQLGPSDRQEEWFPAKQTPAEGRGGRTRDDRGSRGGREERGSRGERGGREERGSSRGRDEDRDNDRGRSRDRDEGRGRDRGADRDERGADDDDIPFNEGREERGGRDEGGEGRARRGGGSHPWRK